MIVTIIIIAQTGWDYVNESDLAIFCYAVWVVSETQEVPPEHEETLFHCLGD